MCAAEKAQMGADTFKQTYGTNANKANAWGKCVSGKAKAAAAADQNASQACTTEQAKDPAAFAAKYGSGKGSAKNAFGKCVSDAVHQAVTTQSQQDASAAATCKTMRKAQTADFASKYGTKPNAFGKCVAAVAKTK
jgi:hypothetical protein